ncbi:MAG: hypothetical protein KatS3mg060_0109 [Dehalococcoidia bacterium]|nr:MAG: hypothetical protein KatS3mg060_0109 [Dehalococcoidia bacterium]
MGRLLLVLLVLTFLPGCALGSSTVVATPTVPAARPVVTPTVRPPLPTPTPAAPGTADGLPGIVVTSPQAGATVSSPVRITGTASVFEGTVQFRIKDVNGQTIGQGVATASQGAPGRGTFSAEIAYRGSGPGTIEVFSQSPRDGSDQFLVRIPVTLR